MNRTLVMIVCFALLLTFGCGGANINEVFDVRTLQGKVDSGLPVEAQAKQDALRRLLNGLQEGIGEKSALDLCVPGIDYRESFEQFFDGHKRLTRWDFNGSPTSDEVPVVLHFDDLENGPLNPDAEIRVERVYVVYRSGARFSISRK